MTYDPHEALDRDEAYDLSQCSTEDEAEDVRQWYDEQRRAMSYEEPPMGDVEFYRMKGF